MLDDVLWRNEQLEGRAAVAAAHATPAAQAAALRADAQLYFWFGLAWLAIPAALSWGALILAAQAGVALNPYLWIALVAAPTLAAPNALAALRECWRTIALAMAARGAAQRRP